MTFTHPKFPVSLILVCALLLSACVAVGPASDAAGDATIPAANQTIPVTEEITLFVGPERVGCTGVAPQQCLQVKRSTEGEEADYELFYESIDGFVFVPGYNYELRVQQTTVDNPPADGSSLAYTLLDVVSRSPAYEGEALPLEGTLWTLVAFGAEDMVVYNRDETPVTAQFRSDTVGGSSGCNNYSTAYTLENGVLSLGAIASTRRACPEAPTQVEQAYLGALTSVSDLTIEGNLLTITYAAGQLTFVAETEMTAGDTATTEGEAVTVMVLNGSECFFTGTGATLAFDSQRLNYTCTAQGVEPMIGLIGEIAQDEAGMLTATRATVERDADGFELTDSAAVTFLISQITLADGTTCAFAGTGATLAFDGERLNYTCGDPSVGLLGNLIPGEAGQWSATKAMLSRGDNGFELEETEEVSVARIEGAEME